MIKSEKKAIKESIKIWTRLAMEGGDKTQEEYTFYESGCPCCDYYKEYKKHPPSDCENEMSGCPLQKKTLCGFANKKSAFHKWAKERNVLGNTRGKRYARKILNALIAYSTEKGWG